MHKRRKSKAHSHEKMQLSEMQLKILDDGERAADIERCCSSKLKYASEWQAKAVADEQMYRCGVELSWYLCPYCSSWHLTSRN